MTITPHHVALCVTDLDRSLRFWCEGLGFETTAVAPLGSEWADAMEVVGEVDATAHFVAKDGWTFELLHFRKPAPAGDASAHRNHVGFTHLSVYVDDIGATLQRLVACGGTLLEATRTTVASPDGTVALAYVADPDGVRILVKQA
jgi:catechol 2,3-dioxygenase-like lactoylglutathione lyase family enzyme